MGRRTDRGDHGRQRESHRRRRNHSGLHGEHHGMAERRGQHVDDARASAQQGLGGVPISGREACTSSSGLQHRLRRLLSRDRRPSIRNMVDGVDGARNWNADHRTGAGRTELSRTSPRSAGRTCTMISSYTENQLRHIRTVPGRDKYQGAAHQSEKGVRPRSSHVTSRPDCADPQPNARPDNGAATMDSGRRRTA